MGSELKVTESKYMKNIKTTLLTLLIVALATQSHATRSFVTKITGHGEPMILIPGLTCKGQVWDEVIEYYSSNYECHVLSLAGFAGTPAIEHNGKFLKTVKDDLRIYIEEQQLVNPILVGHSLGGFVSLSLASEMRNDLGKIVIVDALPFFPASMNPTATAESTKFQARAMRNQMRKATADSLRQSQPRLLQGMITDPEKIKLATQWSIDSDAETVAQSMYEMQTIDLRDQLSKIQSSTLVLGAWIGYQAFGATRESTEAIFNAQYAKLPNYQLEMTDNGKHFIMWDDPEFFFAKVDAFLSKEN